MVLNSQPTSHYLLCIDCLQHENTWNDVFPFITFGDRKPCQASFEEYLSRITQMLQE